VEVEVDEEEGKEKLNEPAPSPGPPKRSNYPRAKVLSLILSLSVCLFSSAFVHRHLHIELRVLDEHCLPASATVCTFCDLLSLSLTHSDRHITSFFFFAHNGRLSIPPSLDVESACAYQASSEDKEREKENTED
jgi:hypothetical protein